MSFPYFLSDGGTVGAAMRSHPWHATPIGAPDRWPVALQTLVQLMLGSNQPMFLVWGPSRVFLYNDVYVPILGRKHPAALGAGFFDVWREIRADIEPLVESVYAGHPIQMDDLKLVLERNGHPEEAHFSFSYSPIRTESGQVAGLFCVVNERTNENRASEHLQLALDAGAIIGTWVWDVPANRIVADERFAQTFGLNPIACREGLPLEVAFESIHPDDRARVQENIGESMRRGGSYRCEYRVMQRDARYHYIEANGRCELDETGTPLRFPGVLLDIEDRRRAEEERDRADAMLRTFIEAVPGVVYAKDRQGRMLVANRGTAELIGKPAEAFVGKTDREFLDNKSHAETVMAHDRRIMETGVAEQIEEQVARPDGAPALWLSSKAPLFNAQGEVIGLVGSSIDITQRKQEHERAQTEAEMLDLLNRTGALLAAELDLGVLLQSVTDAATRLAGARFGAFFYNGVDDQGEALMLYALSGAPRAAFERFGHPRPTPIFEPTFRGGPPIRLDDVMKDPRYGKLGPHHGMPSGHLPVRSYLAVTVVSRSGEVIGGLFFGHPEPGMFTERSERIVVGIAAQAAVAIDNARLYADAQRAARERTALLESERAARAEAERASSLKDDFLATLSHELRTPLSAILGWAHILRHKIGSDPTTSKGLDVIERSTRVQTQLIEDLLDMSRITSGKLRLDMQPIAPLAFVKGAIDSLRPTAAAADVKIALAFDAELPIVEGDAARLQQVLWNLVSNAIKFSPPGSEVAVRVSADERFVRFEVRDCGIGISPEFLPNVFDRFRQADASTTRRYGGLGLGLSIVKNLVELHQGEIGVHSEGEGRGSTFTLLLPRDAQNAQAPDADAAGAPRAHDDLQGVAVLVVDDEPDVLDLLARVLGEAGGQVRAVNSAAKALQELAAAPVDVLVSDIGMPDVDGYELIRRLRKDGGAAAATRAIALTAFARPEDAKRALESGFDVYMSKPVEPLELIRQVRKLAK